MVGLGGMDDGEIDGRIAWRAPGGNCVVGDLDVDGGVSAGAGVGAGAGVRRNNDSAPASPFTSTGAPASLEYPFLSHPALQTDPHTAPSPPPSPHSRSHSQHSHA